MLSDRARRALILTNGQPVTVNVRNGADEGVLRCFQFMGQGYLFGIVPMQLVFFVIVAALAWVVLSYTNFGFRVFAVGGSAKAARVSGIPVNAVKIWAFVLMGASPPSPAFSASPSCRAARRAEPDSASSST